MLLTPMYTEKYQAIITKFKGALAQIPNHYVPATIEIIVRYIKNYLDYLESFSIFDLNEASEELLHEFLTRRQQIYYSKAYIRNRLYTLLVFYAWATSSRFCMNNLALNYKKRYSKTSTVFDYQKEEILGESTRLRPVTSADLEILLSKKLSEFTDIRDKCIISLILATGMYSHEIINLRSDYLSLNNNGKLILNAKTVELSPIYQDACRHWLEIRTHFASKDIPFLFFTENLCPLTRRHLYKTISRFAKKVGITKNIGPEVLRQTAIKLVANGT